MTKLHVVCAFVFLVCSGLFGQETNPSVWVPNQEVRLNNLPSITAASTSRSDVFAAVLETILQDKGLCCGKDSALEDVLTYAGLAAPVPLKELGNKLQGRHLLSDGRPIVINTHYVPRTEIGPGQIIIPLRNQQAQIFEWKSHLYVLCGAIFDESRSSDGQIAYSIRKILLLDPRYSDARRDVVFNRETDDWEKVEGILTLNMQAQ